MASQLIVRLAFVVAVQAGRLLPRETTMVDELDRPSTGLSPVITSRPELAGMELFRRADTPMGSGTCGWFAEYTGNNLNSACPSHSGLLLLTPSADVYTCDQISASCINLGSIRGCCLGPSLSCALTFWTTCLPYSAIPRGFICTGRTTCWSVQTSSSLLVRMQVLISFQQQHPAPRMRRLRHDVKSRPGDLLY
jgi:hypothetical protein